MPETSAGIPASRDPACGLVLVRDLVEPKYPPFIVEDLIHDTGTVIYGRPKAGKSYLTLKLAACLTTGEPFLGYAVRERRSVAFMALDMGLADEIKRRQKDTPMHGLDDAYVTSRRPAHDQAEWSAAAKDYRNHGIDFVIIDNLRRLMPGGQSVRNDESVADALDNHVEELVRSGIAVLVVHHSGKPGEDGQPKSTPLGSTAIEAWGRHFVRVESEKRDGQVYRKMVSYGNALRRPELTIPFTIGKSGVQAAEGRDKELLAILVSGQPWSSQADMATALGVNQSVVSRLLKQADYKRDRQSGLLVSLKAAA